MLVVCLFFVGALHSVTGNPLKLGIIGGSPIKISKVPYMASLRLDGTKHWCGGSIIHERFILTAAHCVEKNHTYSVVVGHTTLDEDKQLVHNTYQIDKIMVHENYSIPTSDYDVTLMRISEPMVFTGDIMKIDLATNDLNLQEGDMLTANGWGQTERNDVSENLLTVKVPYVTTEICQKSYTDLKRIITERMLCAGKPGKDACTGDSGGPLVHDSGVQVGITSFGIGCGNESPGVYTRVSAVRDWIIQTMAQNS